MGSLPTIFTSLDVIPERHYRGDTEISSHNAGGVDGFLAHSRAVAKFYADRRAKFEAAAHKHLDGLATWVSPVAGMFLWIDLSPSGITDTFDLIRKEALAKGVLAVPGYS